MGCSTTTGGGIDPALQAQGVSVFNSVLGYVQKNPQVLAGGNGQQAATLLFNAALQGMGPLTTQNAVQGVAGQPLAAVVGAQLDKAKTPAQTAYLANVAGAAIQQVVNQNTK